ncbi:MAG: AAA family ATPase [Desulfovibrionaceae bacterium]|nr:AAA family ATPase [Desulfovibrionaceae bacterium]
MTREIKALPIGISIFSNNRERNYLYIDKTHILQNLIMQGECYFLARPRRFGKSLTISTLEAMFAGKSDLFRDLKAEPWVQKQSQNPAPVITLDLSGIRIYHSADERNTSLSKELLDIAHEYDINLEEEKYASDYLIQLLAKLSKINQVVLLIDEYDAPIINNLHEKIKQNRIEKSYVIFIVLLNQKENIYVLYLLLGYLNLQKQVYFLL